MSKYRLVFLILFSFTTNVFADKYSDGKSFAEDLKSFSVNDMANSPSTDVPMAQDENVEQTKYYDDGLDIENKAQDEAYNNSTYNFIKDGYENRPKFELDSNNDPLFENLTEIENRVDGLSDTYAGCVDIPVGKEKTDETRYESCLLKAQQDVINFSCEKITDGKCKNANAGAEDFFHLDEIKVSGSQGFGVRRLDRNTFVFGSYYNNRRGQCSNYNDYIDVYIDNPSLIKSFELQQVRYDDSLMILINDVTVFKNIYKRGYIRQPDGTYRWYRCETKRIADAGNISLKPNLRKGWNRIRVFNIVSGGGNVYFKLFIKRIYGCDLEISETSKCEHKENRLRGELKSQVCLDNNEREISGTKVKRCWKYKENYTRLSDPYYVKDDKCKQLEKNGCGQIDSKCIKKSTDGAFCIEQTAKYQCKLTQSTKNVSVCGNDLICPDGKCGQEYQISSDSTDDFKKAATGLAVAKEISEKFNKDELNVFNGEELSCTKKAAGFSNCCKGSDGWGGDLNLTRCTAKEKKLAMMKGAKRTQYVGESCREKILGVCTRKRYTYCAYPSKLARIVVAEGRKQIGGGFGSDEDPNCKGFTIDELNKLDFGQMDFSEYYQDVIDKANNGTTPGKQNAAEDVINRIKQRNPQVK